MLQILLFSTISVLAIWSVGLFASKVVRIKTFNFFDHFWLGIIIIVLFFQFYSLFKPINGEIAIPLYLLILLSIFVARKRISVSLNLKEISNKVKKVIGLSVLYVSTATIFAASFKVNWYDTYLYHLNAVRWIYEYPAVKGLVHIHSRLGFNSSFFIFSAFIEGLTQKGASSHVALTVLTIVSSTHLLYTVFSKSLTALRVYCLFALPFILQLAWRSYQFPSLSTDFASAVFVIVIIYYGLSKSSNKWVLLFGLSAVAFTTKLSTAALIPVTFMWGLIEFRKKSMSPASFLLPSLIVIGILLGFALRNIATSGWLVYPSPVDTLKIDLPWAASYEQNNSLNEDITGWARRPGEDYHATLEQNLMTWLVPWLDRNQTSNEFVVVEIGIVLFVLYLLKGTTSLKKLEKEYLVGLAGIAFSLMLWFVAAPDLRFGSVYFWLLFIFLALPKLTSVMSKQKDEVWSVFLVLLVGLTAGIFPLMDEVDFNLVNIPPKQTFAVERSDFIPQAYIPTTDDPRCGDSVLPCMPYPENIRFVDPTDISKGFLPAE